MTAATFTDEWESVSGSEDSKVFLCWLLASAQDNRPQRLVAVLTNQPNRWSTYRIFEGEGSQLPAMVGGRIVRAFIQECGGLDLELCFASNVPQAIRLQIEPALPSAVYPWRNRLLLALRPLSLYTVRFIGGDQCMLEVKKRE